MKTAMTALLLAIAFAPTACGTGASDPSDDARVADGGLDAAPGRLSEAGLYSSFASRTVASDPIAYQPAYSLWSDGSAKRRRLRLPVGAQIDTSNMDHWQFPVVPRAGARRRHR